MLIKKRCALQCAACATIAGDAGHSGKE